MKKLITVFSVGLLAIGIMATAYAAGVTINVEYPNIKIFVNLKEVNLKDADGNQVKPMLYNGTTYLPVRAISEALGQSVNWDGNTKTIYIGKAPTAQKDLTLENLINNKDAIKFGSDGLYKSNFAFTKDTKILADANGKKFDIGLYASEYYSNSANIAERDSGWYSEAQFISLSGGYSTFKGEYKAIGGNNTRIVAMDENDVVLYDREFAPNNTFETIEFSVKGVQKLYFRASTPIKFGSKASGVLANVLIKSTDIKLENDFRINTSIKNLESFINNKDAIQFDSDGLYKSKFSFTRDTNLLSDKTGKKFDIGLYAPIYYSNSTDIAKKDSGWYSETQFISLNGGYSTFKGEYKAMGENNTRIVAMDENDVVLFDREFTPSNTFENIEFSVKGVQKLYFRASTPIKFGGKASGVLANVLFK